jgi:DNA-binding NtrC family response regulator
VVLVIDDDEPFCDVTMASLQDKGLEVITAHSGKDGIAHCKSRRVDIVLLDQDLPDAKGHSLCPAILEHNDRTKIVIITQHPGFDAVVDALRAGAYEYLSKPIEAEVLWLAVDRALRALELERVAEIERYRSAKDRRESILVGDSKPFMGIKELVNLAASSDAPVLITGETGTGKTHVARAIHYRSPLRRKPFISSNCAALPRDLIESELFGSEKGAFTGADTTRYGIFEMAEGGTLLLDEIGEIPMNLQSKLLGVLEDRQVRRLGGSAVLPVNARILAATSKDIEAVLDNTFRSDLYYRLSVIRIHVPPLRERPEDIPALCGHLLSTMTGGRLDALPEKEIERLTGYGWPGNIRELRNVLERATILQLKRGEAMMPSRFIGESASMEHADQSSAARAVENFTLEQVERSHISAVLEHHSGNLTRTAKALGIALSTLKRKVKLYGLN